MKSATTIEIIIALAGLAAAAIIIIDTYVRYREKKAIEFIKECINKVADKDYEPWCQILGITPEEFYQKEMDYFIEKCPGIDDMVRSFEPLTIENWFSLEDQRRIFEIYPDPEPEEFKIYRKTPPELS